MSVAIRGRVPDAVPVPASVPAPASVPDAGHPWWHDAVIYEIYLPSFQDTTGSGEGDLWGVIARLDYLAGLGVDALWITPHYPSPGADHGYDVSDYLAVAAKWGGEDAFDALVVAAHARGLRVVIDVVPNHTSDQHPWFLAAADRSSPYRDYYIWRDPAPGGGPPNNWIAGFGGSAWTYHPSGQYYLHLYLPEQPDLNWRHPAVRDEWQAILARWLTAGVDGVRIDVAHALLKDPDFPDNPPAPAGAASVTSRVAEARRLRRVHDVDQDDVVEIYSWLRRALPATAAGQEPFLLGETLLDDAERTRRYCTGGPGVGACPDQPAPGERRLDAAMWFGAMLVPFEAGAVAAALAAPGDFTPGRPAWVLSNHDRSRVATRLGGGKVGVERALALAGLYLAMPGPYLLYQGEELGSEDLVVDVASAHDPVARRTGEMSAARDCARSPMWWDEFGAFTTGEPWTAFGPRPLDGPAFIQAATPYSTMDRYRQVITLARSLRERLPAAATVTRRGDVVVVHRGPLTAVTNFALAAVALRGVAHGAGHLAWRSRGPVGGPAAETAAGSLRSRETAWFVAPDAGA